MRIRHKPWARPELAACGFFVESPVAVSYTHLIHTTLAFVHLAPNGDRSLTFCRNHSADTLLEPGELDTALLQSCKVLHVGSLSLTDEPARRATPVSYTHLDVYKRQVWDGSGNPFGI